MDALMGAQMDAHFSTIQPPIMPFFKQKTGIFQRFAPL